VTIREALAHVWDTGFCPAVAHDVLANGWANGAIPDDRERQALEAIDCGYSPDDEIQFDFEEGWTARHTRTEG